MCWLSSRADVDASRAFRMATLKAGEYGEVGEWEARAGRLREIPSVLSSDAFLDEMRRFLPARMLVATVESLSWREYASQAVTGLYDPSGPAWASPYGSPGFGRPMPEPDQSSAVPMWRDGVPLFPEAASSPHSHLIRSARSMGLWYGSVTSMRRVGRP